MAITVRQRRRRPTTAILPLVRGLKMCGLGMAMFIISRESSSSTTQQQWVVSAGSALWKSRFVATRSKRGHIRPADGNVLRLLSTALCPLRGGGNGNFIHTTTAASSPPTPISVPLARQSLSQQQVQHQQQYSADHDDDTFVEEGNPYAVYSPPPSDNADSEFLATGTSSSSSPRSTYSDATEHGDPFHETVQDRVDHWRHQLQENAAQLQQSPRDDKGRLKLLTSVGKGSRTLMFFLLLMRDLSLYEAASELKNGSSSGAALQLLLCTPLMILFLGNLVGALVSLTSSSTSHATKKRLKAILNLDKLLELILISWYLLRLTVLPDRYAPREIYVGRLLHAIFFLIQAHAITRLSWDETAGQPLSTYTTAATAAAANNNNNPNYSNNESFIMQQQQQFQQQQTSQKPQYQGDLNEGWKNFQRQQNF